MVAKLQSATATGRETPSLRPTPPRCIPREARKTRSSPTWGVHHVSRNITTARALSLIREKSIIPPQFGPTACPIPPPWLPTRVCVWCVAAYSLRWGSTSSPRNLGAMLPSKAHRTVVRPPAPAKRRRSKLQKEYPLTETQPSSTEEPIQFHVANYLCNHVKNPSI